MTIVVFKALLLYSIILSTGIVADSSFVESCAPAKCPGGDKFTYEPGYSYFYNYEANVATTISGETEDFTSIFIEAQAEVHAFTSCEFALKLRNVNLRSRDVDNPVPSAFAPGHQQFKEALEKWTLRFSFEDGAIDMLCAQPAEEPWALNIKRAIISTLQNKANVNAIGSTWVMERDIQGNCPTEYVLDYKWMTVSAKKTKDLDKCNERSIFLSAIQSSPYLSPKGAQLNSALRSTYKCVQEFEERVIKRVSCDERHILQPFSNGNSGAMTMTKQSLVLMDESHKPVMHSEQGSSKFLKKTTLLFNHAYHEKSEENSNDRNDQHQAEMALFQLCHESKDDIRIDTPRHFWAMVKSLQKLSYSKLKAVLNSADRICEFSAKGRKYFRDALPLIGNPQSINLMKDLILEGVLTESETNSLLDLIAFHPKPTAETLAAIMPLLKSPQPTSKAYLTIAALANSYCRSNPDCEKTEEIQTLIGLLERQLGKDCLPRNYDEKEKIIVVLKAFGNLGRWRNSYSVLEKCVSSPNQSVSLRLVAIEAYRRLSCSVQRENLLQIFSNTQEDSEIRIAAYLGLMKCPSQQNIDSIWEVMSYESVNQVNSFVWSHLSSIQKSVDPCKSRIRSILEDAELQNKYKKDVRKYSKAFEKSLFSETLNVGGHLETHLVFSTNSFIPRSAMLNLTVDLFGQSINLLELNGRIEGFEKLAESLFRPEPHKEVKVDSKFPTDHLKRTSLTEEGRIQQIVKTVQSNLKTLASSSPDGAASMKVFGQEVWYTHSKSQQIENAVRSWAQGTYADFLQFLAKDNSFEITKNAILLDTTFVVPTLSGLPLILSLNATANVQLKVGGKVDIRGFSEGLCHIDGQIRPSAGISLVGEMTVDGYVGKSGVQLDADLHTSTQFDGKLEVNGKGRVKVHFNMLKDKMEFLNAKTKIVLNHWGKSRPLRSSMADRTDALRCSTAVTSRPLGIEFCSEFRYPNASRRSNSPYFPLTGPMQISLWMKKTDPTLSTYHFEYVYDPAIAPDFGPRTFILSFRTPRASIDREWTMSYRDNPANQSVHMQLLSPYKKAIIKGHYQNEKTRLGFNTDVIIDGDQEFSFQWEIHKEEKVDHLRHLHKIIVRVPTRIIFSLEGSVHYSEGHFLTADISVKDFTIKPIIFRGEIIKDRSNSLHYSGIFESPMIDATIKGSLNRTSVGMISRTHFEYDLASRPKRETVDLTMKMKYTTPASRTLTTATATIDIHTSVLPEYNSIVIWHFQLAGGHIENTIRVDSTKNGRKAQLARFQQILSYNGTLEEHQLYGTFQVNIPTKNIDFVLTVDHENNVRMLFSKIHVQRSIGQKYGLEVHVKDESEVLWRVKGHTLVYFNGQKNGISVSVNEEVPQQYAVALKSQGRPLGNWETFIDYKNWNTEASINQGLWINCTGDLQFFGEGSIFVMDDLGRMKVDGEFRGNYYLLEGNYKEINHREYDGEFMFQNPTSDIRGIVKLNAGEEKVLDFNVSSASGRRIIGGGRLKLFYEITECALNLAWDASSDPKQKITFSIIDERRLQFSHSSFSLIYLDRVVGLEFDHRHSGSLTESYVQGTHALVEWAGAKKFGADFDLAVNSMRHRRQVSGTLDVLTPLTALETIVVNVSHHDDGLSWKSDGALVINRHLPFQAVSLGKYWRSGNQQYMEAATNITTPIEGFETIIINLEHDLASRELEANVKVQWSNNHRIEVHSYAIRPNSKYDKAIVQLNITTPFEAFSSLSFVINHDLKPNWIRSQARLRWNDKERIYIMLNGDAGLHENRYRVLGNVAVITPLHGFDNFTMGLTHFHDAYGFQSQLQGFLPNGKLASLRGEGILRRTENSILLNGNLDLISHLISFGTGLQYLRTGQEFKGLLRGSWNDTFANVSATGVYTALTDFGFDVIIFTPVNGLENATLVIMNRINGTSIMTKLIGKRGDDESGLNLNGQWEFGTNKSRSLDVRFRLDSPVSALPHISLNATHGRTRGSFFRTNLHGSWNELVLSLDHTLVLYDKLNFEDKLTLSLPYDNLEHIQLTINQSWEHGVIKNDLELQVLRNKLIRTSIDLKHSATSDGKRKIDALLKLNSSIWLPSQMEIVVDHVDNGIEYHPKIIFQTMEPKNKVLQLTGYLRSFPGSKIWHLTANTRIPQYENMALAGMYRISDTNLNFNLSTQWNESSKLEVDGEIGIDFLAPRLRLDIVTPKEGYRLFKLDGHYNVWTPEKHASFFVQKESWKLNLAGSGTFEPDEIVAGLIVETPSSLIGTINVNTTAAWKQLGTRGVKVTLTWDNKKIIMIAIGLQPYKNSVTTITTSLITPLQWLRNVDGVIKMSREPNSRLMLETSARWNRADMVETTFILGRDPEIPVDLIISIKSTTPAVPQITISLFTKIVPNLFNSSLGIDYSGKILRSEIVLKTQGRGTEVRALIETPFSSFPKCSFNGSFQQKRTNNYDTRMTLQLPFAGMESLSAEGSMKSSGRSSSQGVLRFSTPTQSASLNAQYEANNTGFVINVVATPAVTPWQVSAINLDCQTSSPNGYFIAGMATTASGLHKMSGKLTKSSSEIVLDSHLASPLLGDRTPVEGQMKIRCREPMAIGTNLMIKEAGLPKHWLIFDMTALEPTSASLAFIGATPLLSNGKEYNISVDVADTAKGLRASTALVLPSGYYFGKTEYERDLSSGLLSFLVDAGSPIKELRQMKVQARKTGDEWDNVAVNLDILTPIEGYDKFSTTISTKHLLGDSFNFQVCIDTPFEGYEEIRFEEMLTYNFNLTSVSSDSNFTFDGTMTTFGIWYNKLNTPIDAGIDAKWLPMINGDTIDIANLANGGKFNFKFFCPNPTTPGTRHCLIDFLLKGTPWEGEGSWNYSDWRQFHGSMFIDTPFKNIEKVGLGASNNMPIGKGSLDVHLILHWHNRRIADLTIRGTSLENGTKQGSFNITTPFSLVRQVDGHGFVLRDQSGIVGTGIFAVNNQTLLNGDIKFILIEKVDWKNRTIAVELDNPWQPFGLAVLTNRHPDVLSVDTSLLWNLVERRANSLRALGDVFYRSSGREARFSVIHPKHRISLETMYQKLPQNFTHWTKLRWGEANSILAAYRIWLHTRPQGRSIIRKDVGLRWEHPGRVVLCIADILHKPKFYQTSVDLKWDASRNQDKRVRLNIDYEDTSNQLGKTHKLKMILHHPKLSRDVEMNSDVILGHGNDLFKGRLNLQYSPNPREKLSLNTVLRGLSFHSDGKDGFTLDFTAKHAVSNLNVELSSDWRKSAKSMMTNTTFVYLNKDGQYVRFVLEGLRDLVNENATFHVKGPGSWLVLTMQHPDPNNYTLTTVKGTKNRPKYATKLFYMPSNNYIEANATSLQDDSDAIRFVFGFKSLKACTIQLLHGSINEEVKDISFFLNLNTSHFLTARAYWVPEIIDQVQVAVSNFLSDVHNRTIISMWSAWDTSLAESLEKFQLGWESFAVAVQPMLDEMKNEFDAVLNDFTYVQQYLEEMYYNNDLLLHDIVILLETGHGYLSEWYAFATEPFNWDMATIYGHIEDGWKALRNAWNYFLNMWTSLSNSWILQIWEGILNSFRLVMDLVHQLWGRAEAFFSALPDVIINLVKEFQSSNTSIMSHFSKLIAVGEKIKEFWEKIKAAVEDIKLWIKEKVIDAFISWIVNSDIYVFLRTGIERVYNAFIHFIRYRFLELLSKFIDSIKLYMSDKQKQIMDDLLNNLIAIRDAVWSFVPYIINHPVIQNSIEVFLSLHYKVIWILQYYELSPPDGYLTIFKWYSDITNVFTQTAEEASDHFDSPNYVLFLAENGVFEMDQQLPFPWKSLKESPQIQEMKEIKTLYEVYKFVKSQDMPMPYNSYGPPFMAWFTKLSKTLDYRQWLPPFEGQAILSGRQHYLTFDGRAVEFASTCNYLLMRDFLDGNFTITVNYDNYAIGRPVRRSISLLMDGKEIEIFPNFQVFVDGKKVELPHSFDNTAIIREANKTVVTNGYGIKAVCHWPYDVCTFKVSGWYFGRLAGMLGTYNYEQADDIVTPDGKVQQGALSSWANTWTVQQSYECLNAPNLAVEPPRKDPIADRECLRLFNDSFSLFKYCYEKVDPAPFLNMCLGDVQTRDTPEDICTSAATYVQACNAQNVFIRMPRPCVKCHLPDGQVLAEAGNVTMNSTTKMADIVFVIEAKKCNRGIVDVFHDLASNIDGAMHLASIRERRYATVVFGGSGVYDDPHTLTSDSQIFTNQRTISSLGNFKIGRGNRDFFDALRFAAKLPFRPGASKNLVVLTCSIGDSVEMRGDYPEVHRMLLEDGITVHLLLDRDFEVKRSELSFYGIDGVNAYTSKDTRNVLIGDPDLRRQIIPPKDICVPIVLESNGTVFSSLHLYESKKMAKSFLDVYSRRVAQSAQVPVCQTCDCVPDADGVGRTYCQPCVFPRPSHFYMDPHNFFQTEYISIYHKDYGYNENMEDGEDSAVDYPAPGNSTSVRNLTRRPQALPYE